MDGKEFIKALKNMAKDLVIDEDYIFASMEQALITAYKKNFHSKSNVKVEINKETGDIKVYTYYVVVDDYIDGPEIVDEEGNITYGEPEIPEDAQMLLEDAKKIDPDAKVGETIKQEVTPKDFGRVAVSTAKQVLTQKIREAERTSIVNEYIGKQDEIMVGMLAMEDNKNYYVDLGRARGILPKSEMIPGETVKMGSSIRVYLTKVEESTKGPLILCSRKNTNFVKRLFEVEIPELADGTLVLYNVAREAGVRSKVAVYSTVNNIDAIGTCIGEKGTRIANILKELNSQWQQKGKPEAIQTYLDSKNESSILATGYACAYWVTNRFFQLAKYRIGLPNAIGGTGFAVRMDWLFDHGGFSYKSLTEDLEMEIEIVKSGGRILWNHHARIYDEKPDDLKISLKQRTRWAQGHWYVAFTNLKSLLKCFFKERKFKYIDQLLYLFGMGKGVQLLLAGMSLLILMVYYIACSKGFKPIVDSFEFYFMQLFVPTTIFNIAFLFYTLCVTLAYALMKEGTQKNFLKAMLASLYFGFTYMYTQAVGLLKWRQQGVWVKTPHKHTKKGTVSH